MMSQGKYPRSLHMRPKNFEQLTEIDKKILLAFEDNDMSVQEIARKTKLSEDEIIKSIIHLKRLGALRKKIGSD